MARWFLEYRYWLLAILIGLGCDGGTATRADESYELLWEHPTPRQLPQSLRVDRGGQLLHVALKSGGFLTLDVSGSMPRERATLPTSVFGGLDVMHLDQQGDFVFLALGDFFHAAGAHAGLAVVDVSRPATPRVVGLWKSPEKMQGAAAVLVEGRNVYLGAMGHGVLIFEWEPGRPLQPISTFLPDVDFPRPNPGRTAHPNARGLAIQGNLLYVADDAGGLRVWDVSKPREPREVGRHVLPGMKHKQQAYNQLVLDGHLAYVAIDYAGLEVVDIRDPRNLRSIAWWNPWNAHTLGNLWFNSGGHTNQICFDKQRRRVWLSAGDAELMAVDISRPDQPALASQYGAAKDGLGAWGLACAGDRVYLTYITAVVPFSGRWAGIKALRVKR
ncbi:MAG: hypothetical protein U0935_24115 [Pirellulales bacterium]